MADIDGDVAELDAEAQWQGVVDAVQECVAAAPDAAAGIVAIGVDSQYSSIVPVRADGTPVAMMRLWSDRRGTDRSFAILEDEEAFFGFIERHGIPPVGGGLSLGHILHLQYDCPDVHAEAVAYLEPMDYVNARLTGRIAANQATQFMSQVIDNRSLGQTSYDDVLLGWAGVDASHLPPLLPLDEPVGTVSAAWCRAAGHPRRCGGLRRHQRHPGGIGGGRRLPDRARGSVHRHHVGAGRLDRHQGGRPRPRGAVVSEPLRRQLPPVRRERPRGQAARTRPRQRRRHGRVRHPRRGARRRCRRAAEGCSSCPGCGARWRRPTTRPCGAGT